ncbi:hypothetical protein D9M71_474920 [compost metagenome]
MDVALLGASGRAVATAGTGNAADAGRQGGEQWIEALDDCLLATDHHAVATFQAPDTARGADINVVQLTFAQVRSAADVVLVEGIAAIDDHIVGVKHVCQLSDGLLGRLAGWQHDPDRSRLFQFGHQRAKVVRAIGALFLQCFHGAVVAVMHHRTMAATHQASCDIAAHAAQPHDSQLHVPMLP